MEVKPAFMTVVADSPPLSSLGVAMPLGGREVVELHCLESVEQCGQIPDGCDADDYVARGYVLQQGLRYLLTPKGTHCLERLRAQSSAP